MRTPVLLALTLCVVLPSRAQTTHLELPDAATHVLAADAATDAAVFITDEGLGFYRDDAVDAVTLPGRLVQARASAGGRHVAALALDDSGPRPALRLSVFAGNGSQRYVHVAPHGYDDPFPAVAVDDATGAAAYGQSATNEVAFLDAEGDVARRVPLFGHTEYELERALHLAYAPDGRHVFVAAMRAPAAGASVPTGTNAELFAFTAAGDLQWSRSLDGPALQSLAVSDDGRYVAVSTYDAFDSAGVTYQTRVFEADGTLVQAAPYGFEHAAISDDALLLVTPHRAVCIGLSDGRPRYVFEPAERDALLIDGTMRPDSPGAALLTGTNRLGDGGYVYDRLQLHTLGPSGDPVDVAARIPDAVRSPRLRAAPDGLHLILDRSVLVFPWIP